MVDKSRTLHRLLVLLSALVLLQACAETVAEAELSGTEWEVVEMTGFPADVIVEGSFRLTSDGFFYDDGVNVGSSSIDWTDTGFVVTESGTATNAGAGPRYLGQLIGGPGDSTTAVLNDETLTLTRDGLSVVALPGSLGS